MPPQLNRHAQQPSPRSQPQSEDLDIIPELMVGMICALGLFKAPGQEIDLGGISGFPYSILNLGGAFGAYLWIASSQVFEIFGVLRLIFGILWVIFRRQIVGEAGNQDVLISEAFFTEKRLLVEVAGCRLARPSSVGKYCRLGYCWCGGNVCNVSILSCVSYRL